MKQHRIVGALAAALLAVAPGGAIAARAPLPRPAGSTAPGEPLPPADFVLDFVTDFRGNAEPCG